MTGLASEWSLHIADELSRKNCEIVSIIVYFTSKQYIHYIAYIISSMDL